MSTIELGYYLTEKQRVHETCIEACAECLVACEVCSDACLDEEMDMSACIRLDRDCADACAAALRTMARGGPQWKPLLTACADACDACAEECDRHAAHHAHCRRCAEACRKCAEECRRMLM